MKNKTIAITGCAGYLGKYLLKRLVAMDCKEIRCFDHHEQSAVETSRLYPDTKWLVGDINDPIKILILVQGADVVIHCAAQKVIPVAEENPSLAIDSNILGSANVAKQCLVAGVGECIGISTDKACNPLTVYGMSKYLMERIFEQYNQLNKTKFYTVRYGNVASSSGSVFEIWDKKGKANEVLEITDPEMTRFFWTVDEAVDFIFEALEKKQTGKPLIPRMKAMRMMDVAEVFAAHYGVGIKEIGNRGNEKVFESLENGYDSNTCERFSVDEIKLFLKKIGCLE